MIKSQGRQKSEVENAKMKNFTHAESPLVNHVQTCYDDQMKRKQMKKLSVQLLIIGYGPVIKEKIEGGLVFLGGKKNRKNKFGKTHKFGERRTANIFQKNNVFISR
jgi:hypothetical protein